LKNNKLLFLLLAAVTLLCSCRAEWKFGKPFKKNNVKIVFLLPQSDPYGYSVAQSTGFATFMDLNGIKEDNVIIANNIDETNPEEIAAVTRLAIKNKANLVIGTSSGFAAVFEKLADEFTHVVFTCFGGDVFNNTNLTSYSSRDYQAQYMCGIVAAGQTGSNKIGFSLYKGNKLDAVYSDINAFALGVERYNPNARIYVKQVFSAADQDEYSRVSEYLQNKGCDVINQNNGIWAKTENTNLQLVSYIVYHWDLYYNKFFYSIIDGSFNTIPYYGGIAEGVIDVSPLGDVSKHKIQEEINSVRAAITDDNFNIFDGFLLTSDVPGNTNSTLTDDSVKQDVNWYYNNIILED
jgi:basic membrane protein A